MQSAPVVRHSGSGGGNKKGTSAERRASHNAIERARRESLNGRFLRLAATLPAICDVQRPSKSLIVNKSLEFVNESLNRETMYRHKIDNLQMENMRLREQLNTFLLQAGMEAVPTPTVDDLPPPMADVGTRKRLAHLNMAGPLAEPYDYDDEDAFAAGSEGETGKTSPMSSSSAASRTSHSNPSAGVPAFTPINNNNAVSKAHYGMPMSVPVGPIPRSEGDTSKWMMHPNFDASAYNMATSAATPNTNAYTYASLVSGMAHSGSVNQGMAGGYESYMTATPMGMQEVGQGHGDYTALRTMHQQQQQQMQQQQLQQQASAQYNFDALNQPHHFFDQAALQSSHYLTAV